MIKYFLSCVSYDDQCSHSAMRVDSTSPTPRTIALTTDPTTGNNNPSWFLHDKGMTTNAHDVGTPEVYSG
jgi:hypothetical protein